MRVTWQPINDDGAAAGKPVVLADTSPRRGPGSKVVMDHQIMHERALEMVTYPRAAQADHFDRGNASTTIAFLIAHEFATYQQCCQYCIGIATKLAGKGNVIITYDGGGTDTLPRAVWQRIAVPPKLGVSTTLNFTFIGGLMNT